MARPRVHFIASSALALLLWRRTGRVAPAIGAIVGGFLIDADHLTDRFLHIRLNRRFEDRIFLPLHGWELVPLFLEVTRRTGWRAATGFTLSYLVHLLVDQSTNGLTHPLAYSLVFRATRGFDGRLFETDSEGAPHEWRDERSLRGLLRWF